MGVRLGLARFVFGNSATMQSRDGNEGELGYDGS